ncbi:MAG: hypothetical protein CBB68_14185 [Rhodospirillaceae bacterium TMED8]|nr:MAG: hypothetical protein CBB68_14185 [Rhodospirillaceae bacterium TMED8]
MSGNDEIRLRDLGLTAGAFAVILVEPQLGENIGMVARAMANCGVGELRLVNPRNGWPNSSAFAAASGADSILNEASVYTSTADSIADLHTVLATTARHRDMTQDVYTAADAANFLRVGASKGHKAGVMFGKESMGLKNEDVSMANGIITVPLNPVFTSLNLAQAVFVVAYEWYQAGDITPAKSLAIPKETRLANSAEMQGLFDHLEAELTTTGFLRVKEKRSIMIRNLRNLLNRARLTEQEVRTLRGVIKSLARFSDQGNN